MNLQIKQAKFLKSKENFVKKNNSFAELLFSANAV